MAGQDRSRPGFVALDWRGRPLSLEVQWVGSDDPARPVVVFLHEGLGSVAMWKDFPQQFCERHGLRGLLYSRYGYGNSTPRPAGEQWEPDFMHRQAHEVLPALLAALDIDRPWLFGHSDGGSIALLHAARFAENLRGVIVLAPHIFVEDISVSSIRVAREAYLRDGLRERLARYHADVDSAFRGWNDIWLDPAFRDWNIEAELPGIRCPVLAVQGEDDEYGTLEQIHGIARKVPQARTLVLPDCGHSPHRDQPEALSREAGNFIGSHG
nr:alpha/beta hydrolase [uncultured Noviherbaspirillum sp.]